MSTSQKIIVIGGNAAGPSAAAKAKRVDPDAEVLLIEAGEYISTGTCELPYLLAGEIDNYNDVVFFSPDSFYEEKNVKVLIKHYVESIDRNNKSIKVRNLNDNSSVTLEFDKLILTTGAKAKKIPNLKSSVQNSFTLKTVTDYKRINSYLKNNHVKNVAIFGSGFIGLETAEAFSKLGMNVTIIEKEKMPLPSSEQEVSALVHDILKNNNVEFIGGFNKYNFVEQENKIKAVNIDGRIIDTDLIIAAIGFTPNSQLALAAGLKIGKHNGIIIDHKSRTSDQFIYAAGDCIEVPNFITKRPDYFPLATIAHNFGHLAGANAAGENNSAEHVIKNIAFKIFDNVHVNVGLTTKEAKEHGFQVTSVYALAPNLVKVIPQSRKIFGKLIYEKGSKKILGAVFLGGDEVTGYGDLISSLILQKQTTNILSRINFNYTPPSSPFINILSILGRKAK